MHNMQLLEVWTHVLHNRVKRVVTIGSAGVRSNGRRLGYHEQLVIFIHELDLFSRNGRLMAVGLIKADESHQQLIDGVIYSVQKTLCTIRSPFLMMVSGDTISLLTVIRPDAIANLLRWTQSGSETEARQTDVWCTHVVLGRIGAKLGREDRQQLLMEPPLLGKRTKLIHVRLHHAVA